MKLYVCLVMLLCCHLRRPCEYDFLLTVQADAETSRDTLVAARKTLEAKVTALEKEMQAKLDSTVKAQELEEELDRLVTAFSQAVYFMTLIHAPFHPELGTSSTTLEKLSRNYKVPLPLLPFSQLPLLAKPDQNVKRSEPPV